MNYKYWKGEKYQQGGLLIVGESFYAEEKYVIEKSNDPDLCIKMIKDVLDLSWVSSTHKRLQEVLNGEYKEKNVEFYNSIAYHQLVQRAMNTSSERPNRKDYVEGLDLLFSKVLPELQPKLVLFLGVGSVNEGLKTFSKKRKDLLLVPVVNGKSVGDTAGYPRFKSLIFNGEKIDFLWINHPMARKFKSNEWREMIRANYPEFLLK